MAKKVLERNSVVRDDFAEAVRILLDKESIAMCA